MLKARVVHRVDDYGFLVTPYRKVAKGKLTDEERDSAFTQSPWFIEENRLASLLSGQPANQLANLSENSGQLIRAIRNAPVHGLNTDSYGLSQIMIAVDALDARDKPLPLSELLQGKAQRPDSNDLRKSLSARLDLAFARLATHLGEGVVDVAVLVLGVEPEPFHRSHPVGEAEGVRRGFGFARGDLVVFAIDDVVFPKSA